MMLRHVGVDGNFIIALQGRLRAIVSVALPCQDVPIRTMITIFRYILW